MIELLQTDAGMILARVFVALCIVGGAWFAFRELRHPMWLDGDRIIHFPLAFFAGMCLTALSLGGIVVFVVGLAFIAGRLP